MFSLEYRNYLINNIYSFTGKTIYYNVWKLDDEGRPYDVWGSNFRSIKGAKHFIDGEIEND